MSKKYRTDYSAMMDGWIVLTPEGIVYATKRGRVRWSLRSDAELVAEKLNQKLAAPEAV